MRIWLFRINSFLILQNSMATIRKHCLFNFTATNSFNCVSYFGTVNYSNLWWEGHLETSCTFKWIPLQYINKQHTKYTEQITHTPTQINAYMQKLDLSRTSLARNATLGYLCNAQKPVCASVCEEKAVRKKQRNKLINKCKAYIICKVRVHSNNQEGRYHV